MVFVDEPITFEVTQADIDAGVKCDSTSCPIARALSRATGQKASVGVQTVGLAERVWWLPTAVSSFVMRFDLGEPVEPATFTLTTRHL